MDKSELGNASALHRLVREPLVQFLVLAGLLFAAQAVFVGDTREEIYVDATTVEFLVERERELTLQAPGPDRIQQLVESYIEEEILVREATKRGFTDSSRVRALLVQNMRFFITGDIPEPTDEVLRAFFEAEKESFASPPSMDLDHMLFEEAETVPSDLLQRLNAGENPDQFGDLDLTYGRILRFMDVRRLSGAFGVAGAQQVLDIAEGDTSWHGPIESPQGSIHFVRVSGRNAPVIPDFETARDWISTQWVATEARRAMDAELSVMREDYRVTIEQPAP
ncbi:MAG: peptidylprolyl isomerase [Pseudomonadota bacterium]